MLNRYRQELEKEYTLLFPPQDIFEKAIHKDLTIECARHVGIRVPETAYPQTIEEVGECRHLRFPVILKLAHHQFAAGTAPAFPHKYLRVDTYEELHRSLEKLPSGQFPMVQEYVPGTGFGVSMLFRRGEPVLTFGHRRIREFPPAGGIGVMCEAIPPEPSLREQSKALLAAMAWDGVAMVEYRGDSETGQYALMEVNGRFWGSLPTAVHAGADFPFWLYLTSFPGAPLPPREYRLGMKARSLAGDTKWLLAVLRDRSRPVPQAIREYLSSFRPGIRYFLWAWDDPRPAIVNFLRRFLKR